MKLKNFAALCFDMDFTLANYNLENFSPMIYHMMAKYLVIKKGYSKELNLLTASDLHLMRRGVILDKSTHCIIDVSSKGEVISALRGTDFLSQDKIRDFYPDGKWGYFCEFYNYFDGDKILPSQYLLFDSVFVSPIIPLISKHLDTVLSDDSDTDEICQQFYKDITDALTANFHPDNFKRNTGSYFPEMKKNPSLYLHKASVELLNKLKEIRSSGTLLVVVTASHIDYTELMMRYCYGSEWRSFFDLICCRARKPGFFLLPAIQRPFYKWNPKNETQGIEIVKELDGQQIYLEGHWTAVDKWIKCHASKTGRVAYVGDSFKSDIVPTKAATSWDLFSITLEGKLHVDNNPASAENNHAAKRRHVSDDDCWGSFFGTRNKPTITGGKLLEHSDLTLSDIEVLSQITLDQDFGNPDSGNFFDFTPI